MKWKLSKQIQSEKGVGTITRNRVTYTPHILRLQLPHCAPSFMSRIRIWVLPTREICDLDAPRDCWAKRHKHTVVCRVDNVSERIGKASQMVRTAHGLSKHQAHKLFCILMNTGHEHHDILRLNAHQPTRPHSFPLLSHCPSLSSYTTLG